MVRLADFELAFIALQNVIKERSELESGNTIAARTVWLIWDWSLKARARWSFVRPLVQAL